MALWKPKLNHWPMPPFAPTDREPKRSKTKPPLDLWLTLSTYGYNKSNLTQYEQEFFAPLVIEALRFRLTDDEMKQAFILLSQIMEIQNEHQENTRKIKENTLHSH